MSGMLSKYILPGNKVEVTAVSASREPLGEDTEKKVYETQIHDVLSDSQIAVLMPIEQSKLVLLSMDGEYDLCIYTDGGLFQCFAKVIDRYKDNQIYVAVCELTTNLRKFQRREYYRFSCALEMNSRALSENEEKAVATDLNYKLEPGLPLKRSVIVDISGGGLRFVANYRYEKGDLILCKYNLFQEGGVKEYSLLGKVLDVKEVENRPGVFEHRVQYRDMDVDVREEIIRYIFNEERKNRRKEKGL